MTVGGTNPAAAAVEMIRSAVAANATQQRVQAEVAKQALETTRVQGQAAVRLIEAADVGQWVDVRA